MSVTTRPSPVLDFETARFQLLSRADLLAKAKTVSLQHSHGQVLAQSLFAPIAVPAAPVSALDGYAISRSDLAITGETVLPVSQRIAAGSAPPRLQTGTAARIFTGAAMPEGADAIIAQEKTRLEGDRVAFDYRPDYFEDVKATGSDIQPREQLLQAGRRLRPQDLALAACVGVDQLSVYRPLRVALLCTGDELVEPGQPLPPGSIYNANQYLISAQLEALGLKVVLTTGVTDTLKATRQTLLKAAGVADVIITTGGVSVGEEDHVRAAIKSLGELHLWRVNMKPGKPFTYGEINHGSNPCPVIGLPGNPVSAFLNFALFARPFLLRAQGAVDDCEMSLSLPADFDWRRPSTRREFLRARVDPCDAEHRVALYPHQGSSALISTTWANGIVMLHENTTVNQGDRVAFIPLASLNLF